VREAKRQEVEKLQHTFRTVGEEWAATKLEKENKAKATTKRERWNRDQLNREIGDRPLCEIAPPELLTAFRGVAARGRYYTVGRLRSTASTPLTARLTSASVNLVFDTGVLCSVQAF
jgi:integrase